MAVMGHCCTSIDHTETLFRWYRVNKKRDAQKFSLYTHIINFDQNQINVISLRRFHGQLKLQVFLSRLGFSD
jgi:hypothetical protein